MATAVAMSGGVDSTAALLVLREQGRTVFGLTALLSDDAGSGLAAERCATVCRGLGVRHEVVDLREAFGQRVIQPFIEEYAAGRTPNPCVVCNEHIKFGLMLGAAGAAGATHLATGHYAAVDVSPVDGPYLLRGADLKKDQSYVLHHVPTQALAQAAWVHGERMREENERLVAEAGLALPPLPPSQDACFIPDADLGEWLEASVPQVFRPGPIESATGAALGEHRGLIGYTVGQRKGLGVGGPGGRKFVLHIDLPGNRLILGEDADLWVRWCEASDVNCIGSVEDSFDCHVMTRYNGPLTPAQVTLQGTRARVDFAEPARAPTPGQSAVFYQGRRCLGGGVISRTELTARFGA